MHISCICTFVVFYQYRLGSFTDIDTIATIYTLNKSGQNNHMISRINDDTTSSNSCKLTFFVYVYAISKYIQIEYLSIWS